MKIILFRTDDAGCGVDGTQRATCSLPSAYIQSYLYPIPFVEGGTHFWKIRGIYGQFIYFKIIDFEIKETGSYWYYPDDMDYFYTWNRYNSFLDVFDLTLGNTRTSMGRFTGIDAPRRPLNSSWHMMDIELRSGSSLTGRGFVAWYMLIDRTAQTDLNSSGY
jgi:hypothetical protein